MGALIQTFHRCIKLFLTLEIRKSISKLLAFAKFFKFVKSDFWDLIKSDFLNIVFLDLVKSDYFDFAKFATLDKFSLLLLLLLRLSILSALLVPPNIS